MMLEILGLGLVRSGLIDIPPPSKLRVSLIDRAPHILRPSLPYVETRACTPHADPPESYPEVTLIRTACEHGVEGQRKSNFSAL